MKLRETALAAALALVATPANAGLIIGITGR
jgi:hypothetical protein